MSEAEVQVTAADAARRLDVSGTGLRRLADIYAKVHGPLQRDERTKNRIWNLTAVERLEAARGLLQSGRAASIEAALIALAEGAQPPADSISTPTGGLPQGIALGMLAERFAALERDNQEMRAQLTELLELNRASVKQLEAQSKGGQSETETAQINRYLFAELERRRLEAEAKASPRSWWRFWKTR